MKLEDLQRLEFSSTIRPVVSKEVDKYLSLASALDLKDFIPNIDPHNIDLLPVAFNAFVVNRVNKNKAVMDTATAIEIHRHFKNKPINVEHDSGSVVGVLLSSGFSEFGSDKILTEDDVKDKTGPFNVVLGGVLWRAIDNDIVNKVEQSSDPTSLNFGKISASWEILYKDYDLVKIKGCSKNSEDGVVISKASEEFKEADRIFSEKGYDKDTFYYRKPTGFVLPAGIGLTGSPAAEVKGVVTPRSLSATKASEKIIEENEKIISQSPKTVVTINEKHTIMKLSHVNEITEESLKTLQASTVKDFLNEEIKKASDSYIAEKSKVEEALKLAKTQAADINGKLEAAQNELNKVKEDLKKLQDEKLVASQLEAFNKRMAALDEKYEFSDEMKKVIAAQVKACVDEASYKTWEDSMQVFFKAYDKASKQEALKKEQAAKTPENVVANAVEGAAKKTEETQLPPNAALASSKSKWADALKEESIIIK